MRALRRWPPALLACLLLSHCGESVQESARSPAVRLAVAQLEGADAARGRDAIRRHGCISCHTIPGIGGPGSNVGPPLENFARRAYIGGVLPNTAEDLVRWLRDPPAVDPRTTMPDMNLSEQQARDIAAYLYTLD